MAFILGLSGAGKEIYDYVGTVSPDVDETLNVDPQTVLTEMATKNDVIHKFDSDDEERVALGSDFLFWIIIQYDLLTEGDAGTVFDFFCDSAKGNGKINSFKFTHPDGHTYVVRFDTDMTRLMDPVNYGIKEIRFYVLGRIVDP